MPTRTFYIGDIISVATGRYVTRNGMPGIHALLDWMTGDTLMTHQLPRAFDECAPDLLRQFPQLVDLTVPEFATKAQGWAWTDELPARFGEFHEVTPLPAGDHAVIDPIAELRMMRPDLDPIIVVLPEGT